MKVILEIDPRNEEAQKQLADMSKEQSAALDSIASQTKSDDAETAQDAKQLADQYGEKGMQQDMQQMSGSMEAGEQSESQQQAKQLGDQAKTDYDPGFFGSRSTSFGGGTVIAGVDG